MNEPRKIKQYIVVRRDLELSVGRMCAQVAHASMMFMNDLFRRGVRLQDCSKPLRTWLEQSCTKIVLGVDSLEDLIRVQKRADNFQVLSELMTGEIDEVRTPIMLAVGPDDQDDVDEVVANLRLFSVLPLKGQPQANVLRNEVFEHRINDRVKAVVGRPGSGKSTTVMHMAFDAIEAGKHVLFISLEHSPKVLCNRMEKILAETSASIAERWKIISRKLTISTYLTKNVSIQEIHGMFSQSMKERPGLIIFDGIDDVRGDTGLTVAENHEKVENDFIAMCHAFDADGIFTRQTRVHTPSLVDVTER